MRVRPYFGWYVVAACLALAVFGWGLGFYGLGVYGVELQARHGWPTGLLSTATTAFYLAGAVLLVFFADAVRRWGPRTTVLAGVVAMAVGTAGLPFVRALWQVYAAHLVMAIGWAAMSSTAIATLLAPWFDRRRGLAISIALSGASGGGIVMPPVLLALIGRFGFPAGMATIDLLMLLLLVPVLWSALGPRGPVRPAAPVVAYGSAAAVRDVRFWGVAVPFALGLTAQVGFLTHQVALLAPRLGATEAGLAVSLTGAMALLGRVALGAIVDAISVRWTAAAVLATQAAALLLLAFADPASRPATYAACAMFGLSVGNVITLPALVVQREFPAASFGTVIGLSTAIGQVTYAFGPALVGLAHDATGGYGAALGLCIALELIAATAILLRPRTTATEELAAEVP